MQARQVVVIGAVLLFLLGMQSAQAQLLFSLNPAQETGLPGTSVTFNATLTNAGTDTIFLNGASFNGLAPGLMVDPTPFFTNFPFFLVGEDAATADLFQVSIDPSVQAGDYIGSFSIVGGADANAQDTLATQNFLVHVPSAGGVPEPGGLALLGAGMLCALPLLCCRR